MEHKWLICLALCLYDVVVQQVSSNKTQRAVSEKPSFYNHQKSKFWCPDATCVDSKLCQPCQHQFLMIFATGRSASTTLTWMLDELPGIQMSGENNQLLLHLRSFYNNVVNNSLFLGSSGKKSKALGDTTRSPSKVLAVQPKTW